MEPEDAMEQFVSIEIELLSVSYILGELFLLCVRLFRTQNVTVEPPHETPALQKPEQKLPLTGLKQPNTIFQ